MNSIHRMASTLTFCPFVGVTPEPIDMPLGGVPDIIIHAKFYFSRLTGFSVVAPPKVSFPIFIRMIVTVSNGNTMLSAKSASFYAKFFRDIPASLAVHNSSLDSHFCKRKVG